MEANLKEIFINYEDKENLSIKTVKEIYKNKYKELSKDEGKQAKKIIMGFYIEYNDNKENAPEKIKSTESKKRPRAPSEDKENSEKNIENEKTNNPGTPEVKQDIKKQKTDETLLKKVHLKGLSKNGPYLTGVYLNQNSR